MNKIKFLMFTLLVCSSLYSVELPLDKKYEITIANGEFTVFEFPFDIKKTFSSGFLLNKSSDEIKKIKEKNSQIIIDPRTKKTIPKRNKAIQIKQGKSSITFLPKARGSFKIVIWGYKKYPVMFNIKVDNKDKKKDELEYYYKFIDYSKSTSKAVKFETDPHEKVIVKLIRSIYQKKLPTGYKNIKYSQTFQDETFTYDMNYAYSGKRYRVEEWMITNNMENKIKLYEELFAKENVYAVAFENDLIKSGETTRVFIVRKETKGDY